MRIRPRPQYLSRRVVHGLDIIPLPRFRSPLTNPPLRLEPLDNLTSFNNGCKCRSHRRCDRGNLLKGKRQGQILLFAKTLPHTFVKRRILVHRFGPVSTSLLPSVLNNLQLLCCGKYVNKTAICTAAGADHHGEEVQKAVWGYSGGGVPAARLGAKFASPGITRVVVQKTKTRKSAMWRAPVQLQKRPRRSSAEAP